MSPLNVEIIQRVKMEFMEMPGLTLTRPQASRLWNLDGFVCHQILSHLVGEQFLAEKSGGIYLRRTSGRA